MCIAFWLLDEHPAFWLILALNRDELLSRPTRSFHFWDEKEQSPHLLAGRDVLYGGTWMGITKTGRLAFLTNVRELENLLLNPKYEASKSRGHLPLRFFQTLKSPVEYVDEIAREAGTYSGFNLVVADMKHGEMAFLSNRHGGSNPHFQKVSPGLHSLSNATLDSQWPKMERGKKLLAEILADSKEISSAQILEKLLGDSTRAADVSAQRADTCCPEDMEKPLSSIFVETVLRNQPYGTRSMVVMGMKRDGTVSLLERYLEGGQWKEHSFQFVVDGVVH